MKNLSPKKKKSSGYLIKDKKNDSNNFNFLMNKKFNIFKNINNKKNKNDNLKNKNNERKNKRNRQNKNERK